LVRIADSLLPRHPEDTAVQDSQTSTPRRYPWRLFPAAFVIGIGLLFLLNNLGVRLGFLLRGNGWATFILLAALAPLVRAIEVYRARGRFDRVTAYYLLATCSVAQVGAMFPFGLDWAVWWPLFVILGACAPWRAAATIAVTVGMARITTRRSST